MYDASRFYFICSAGELPPNLQGIWNGVFTAPWNGSYTFDTNVQNAMDSALSANMMEGMEGYFRLIESFLPDWRINAQKLFGARGIVSPDCRVPKYRFAFLLWRRLGMAVLDAGGRLVGQLFLRLLSIYGGQGFSGGTCNTADERSCLVLRGLSDREGCKRPLSSIGHRFRPKWCALLISDNSTMDIAVAKELLTNLIAACKELQVEKENVVKWRAMLERYAALSDRPGWRPCRVGGWLLQACLQSQASFTLLPALSQL